MDRLVSLGVAFLQAALSLLGTPYMPATLEVNKTEQLVVNTRQVDCTTFVEYALAEALSGDSTCSNTEFRHQLTRIRYRDGKLDGYASRNHYFTQWISSNERQGIVKEITSSKAPFTATQKIDLHYMSKHPTSYPMLKNDKVAQHRIREYEKKENGQIIRYIPRSQLNQTQDSPLGIVHDGDILAIVTKKDGLDTSHIGIAKWGKDNKLHLLNASQIHKKVVIEPMTLYEYMGHHPSQLGIRVVRVVG